MTWHQWHQTAEIESRIGLSSLLARSKASSDQGCQLISLARLGRGEKWNSVLTRSSVRRGWRAAKTGRGTPRPYKPDGCVLRCERTHAAGLSSQSCPESG